jgi:hypothetical protein
MPFKLTVHLKIYGGLMKILKSDEVDSILGKNSFFKQAPAITQKIEYVSGVDCYDDLIDPSLVFKAIRLMNLAAKPNGLLLQLTQGFKNYYVALTNDEIKSIHLEDKEQVYSKKERSVVGRAIVGGLVLGPLGAVVGAASGLKDGVKKGEMPDLLLSITKHDDSIVVLSCKYKHKIDVHNFLLKNFKQYEM